MNIYRRVCGRFINAFRKLFVKKLKVAVLGLENSGKSALISRVFEQKFPESAMQVRDKVKRFTVNNVDFVVYDVPGSREHYTQWDFFYKKCDVVIYCYDSSSDDEHGEEAKKQMNALFYRNIWTRRPLLVIGTKNDIPNAKGCTDIILDLNLESIIDREIACYSVSAKTGGNIELINTWLMEQSEYVNK